MRHVVPRLAVDTMLLYCSSVACGHCRLLGAIPAHVFFAFTCVHVHPHCCLHTEPPHNNISGFPQFITCFPSTFMPPQWVRAFLRAVWCAVCGVRCAVCVCRAGRTCIHLLHELNFQWRSRHVSTNCRLHHDNTGHLQRPSRSVAPATTMPPPHTETRTQQTPLPHAPLFLVLACVCLEA